MISAGAPFNQRKVEFNCVVECEPRCEITWFQNDTSLTHEAGVQHYKRLGGRFNIRTTHYGMDTALNLLSHVESILEVDFSNTEDPDSPQLLLPNRDNTNFTCKATGNSVGSPVESTTTFRIHYPPREIKVTPE